MSLLDTIIGGIAVFIFGIFLKDPVFRIKNEFISWLHKLTNGFSKNNSINSYFHIITQFNPIDIVAYQFGLRPNLPVIDILYLELLKKLHTNGKIKKIIIFPTIDKSSTQQTKKHIDLFKKNISKVYNHNKIFEIIDPYRKSELSSYELIEPDFIDTLFYLGKKEFYNTVFEISKKSIEGIEDFNKFHPKEKRILTLITHVFKAWEIRKYILDYIQNSDKEKMNVGFLFWEVEYDKWGIYKRTAEDTRIHELSLFIGKSILSKKRIIFKRHNKPIAVYTRDAIGIFDDKDVLIDKISKHDRKQVNLLIEILATILRDNYDFKLSKNELIKQSDSNIQSLISSDKVFSDIYFPLKPKIKIHHKVLFTLLLKLRSKYESTKPQ